MQIDTSIQSIGDAEKKRLRESIVELQKQQEQIGKKIDRLEEKFNLIKREFFSRIGVLYTTIDQLNGQIEYYRDIGKLIDEGLSLKDAKKQLKNQKIEEEKKKERKRKSEEYIFIPDEESDLPEENAITLKELYRKLTRKFHPDLVQDVGEKRKREEIMKKINTAFADKNVNLLTRLDDEEEVIDYEHATVDFLKKKLIQHLNLIDIMKKEHRMLLRSEWNSWKKKIEKGKKEGIDVFKNLANTLTEEIRKKKIILEDFKTSYETN